MTGETVTDVQLQWEVCREGHQEPTFHEWNDEPFCLGQMQHMHPNMEHVYPNSIVTPSAAHAASSLTIAPLPSHVNGRLGILLSTRVLTKDIWRL